MESLFPNPLARVVIDDLSKLNLSSTYGDLCSSRCCKKYILQVYPRICCRACLERNIHGIVSLRTEGDLARWARIVPPKLYDRNSVKYTPVTFLNISKTSQSQEVDIHCAVTIAELPYLYVNSQLEK